MPTPVKETEERSHSARYLVLIFLVCVATCGVFFSLGFLVGYNERSAHVGPSTEVVGTPPAIPPAVNPPPDSAPAATPDSTSGPATATETETLPGGGEANASAAAKPGSPAPNQPSPSAPPALAANSPAPAADEVGQGITLQVVALRTRSDAEALVSILKGRGYPVFLVTPEFAHADDNLYRVLVGPFKSKEDADRVRGKLVQDGFKPFMRH